MDKKLIFLVIFLSMVNFGIFAKKTGERKKIIKQDAIVNIPVSIPVFTPFVPPKPIIEKIMPEFKEYLAIRSIESELGKVLGDIEAHMPAGHIYKNANDKINWAHETSHGIHSNIRQKFSNLGKINGFYVLNNKAVVIKEPNTTIRNVATKVPNSLRGGTYNLYLVQQAGSWNDTPLYILDEWSAYTNGSACRLDLEMTSRSESVLYMLEFNIYSSCVAWTSQSNDPQLKAFLMFQIERAMSIYKDSSKLGNLEKSHSYLETMRTSSDAADWRGFCKQYYGADWCLEILGF